MTASITLQAQHMSKPRELTRSRARKRRPDTLYGRVRRAWVIDPRSATWISYWDLITSTALIFTALVTPVEVAFLEPPEVVDRLTNGLYMTNRLVDCIFVRLAALRPLASCGLALPLAWPLKLTQMLLD